MNSDTAGGISTVYSGNESSGFNFYLNYNSFTMNDSRASAVKVQGFGETTLPIYIQHNNFSSNGYAAGIMLSSVTGAVIGHNNISGFSKGLNLMFSTADLLNNSISNTSSSSTGILASSSTVMNLSRSIEDVTAGYNTVINTSSNSKNIDIQSASFFLNSGRNTFDVASSSPVQNYHLYGTIPSTSYSSYATYNCFKLNGTTITSPSLPVNSVYTGIIPGSQISFDFNPYECTLIQWEDNIIVDIGYDLYDTIPVFEEGYGGGKSNFELSVLNDQLKEKQIKAESKVNSAVEIEILSRNIYDSICIQMRYRNYENVRRLCYELIDNYPDSIESNYSLLPLYLSELQTNGDFSELETYYENLILNNQDNEEMISDCNYLIQKCKVKLGQYSSAMNGFQQIINNNPYSYEGLLARWDYAAASLLDTNGSGGGNKNYELEIMNNESPEKDYELVDPEKEILNDDPDDKYNEKVFTKLQRKILRETITTATQIKKRQDEDKIQQLTEKINAGDVQSDKELSTMKLLKEINKSYKPSDIDEHLQTINSDIQKVFSEKQILETKNENLIPEEYNLSQNYPNPFNPTTKIQFELPEEGKVKLIVYDLLGREITKLLNNEYKTAGRYALDFNGSNLASGVYFYRLETNNFTMTKRMVLLK